MGLVLVPGEIGGQLDRPYLTVDGFKQLIKDLTETYGRKPTAIILSEYDRRELNQQVMAGATQDVAKDDQRPRVTARPSATSRASPSSPSAACLAATAAPSSAPSRCRSRTAWAARARSSWGREPFQATELGTTSCAERADALDDHALTEIGTAAADLSVLQTLRIL
jgi:hypothetical protein